MAMSPARLRERGVPYWKQLIVGGLYTGLSPIASGTVGSAVAALVYFLPGGSNFYLLLALALVAFLGGIPLAAEIERATGKKDPGFVTLDEFAGQWVALASPLIIPNPYWVVLSFFVFRAFDISKLWPASAVERRGGGLGVMGDDIVAGLYANIASHLIFLGAGYVIPVVQFLR